MLDDQALLARLPVHGIGAPLYFFESTGSTNVLAWDYAAQGGAHGALFVAEAQTAGRGRVGRKWYTPANSALAFSLVLRSAPLDARCVHGLVVLGALAVVEALETWRVDAEIKWPNDVLIGERKTAGILVETSWAGDKPDFAVIGIGINVRAESVPFDEHIDFPATCVEIAARSPVSREDLLLAVLQAVGKWYARLGTPEIEAAWNRKLAFRGRQVFVNAVQGEIRGTILGVESDGKLQLKMPAGEICTIATGDVRLRPVDTKDNSNTLGA